MLILVFKAPSPSYFMLSLQAFIPLSPLCPTACQVKSQILEVPPLTPQDLLGSSQVCLLVPTLAPALDCGTHPTFLLFVARSRGQEWCLHLYTFCT